MFKIYFSKRGCNVNAIDFYISIIEKSIRKTGNKVERTNCLNDIKNEDIVVTLEAHSFFEIWNRNNCQKIINWFQGVVPEEIYYKSPNLFGLFKKIVWTYFEKKVLSHSYLNIFVSERMLEHYRDKYNYLGDNYVIMPCFNQNIHPESFYKEKYENPSFVYTGSLVKWQCFKETILLFKEIKSTITNASLTVITKDIELAKKILNDNDLYEVEIKSIHYSKINEELSKYKYGFLIREDIILNNVATPTKMSTYLSCGLIPVYSSVINDFKKHLSDLKWSVEISNSISAIEQIKNIEKQTIDPDKILNDYNKIFEDYYNEQKYVDKICNKLLHEV